MRSRTPSRPRLALAPVAALAAALGAGCVSGAEVRADVAAGRTPGAVVAAVPFVEQEGREDCGATAVEVVLAHAGRPVDRAALQREMVRPSVGGSFTFDVGLAVRRRGLHPWERGGASLGDLGAWVRAGRPPIVLLGVRPFDAGLKHFAVVTGVDEGRGLILLHDGRGADEPVELGDFIERWERGGRWALAAVPPEAALPEGLLLLDARERARLGWLAERAGSAEAALEHYRAAVALEPGLAPARANLGRLLLVLGRAGEAEVELRRALALAPGDVRARNNLAHALVEEARGLPPGPARSGRLAEAESHAKAAAASAPADLQAVCLDTLARVSEAARSEVKP